jgi:hypothetical protein
MLVAGLSADPIRKLTPDNPVFIQVLFLFIFFAIYFVVILMKKEKKGIFFYYPNLNIPLYWFFLFLSINVLRPILVNVNSFPVVMFGLVQYLGLIVSAQLGFYLIKKEDDVVRFANIYILTLTPFLFSVLLHAQGLQQNFPVLQTMEIGDWYHWHAGTGLLMLNGLFRNPEPMGFHAAIVTICALFLLFRVYKNLPRSIFYIFSFFLGIWCVLLSGRRKFFAMIIAFIIIFLILLMRKSFKKVIMFLLIVIISFSLGLFYLKSQEQKRNYIEEENNIKNIYVRSAKTIFIVGKQEWDNRVVGSINGALKKDGFFGAGLGTTAQGVRHIKQEELKTGIPSIESRWFIESGPGKIISDLGVPGLFALIIVIWVFFHSVFKIIFKQKGYFGESMTSIFLFSFIVAHLLSFLVSHQIYADPLAAILTGLTFGFLLATPKIIVTGHG